MILLMNYPPPPLIEVEEVTKICDAILLDSYTLISNNNDSLLVKLFKL